MKFLAMWCASLSLTLVWLVVGGAGLGLVCHHVSREFVVVVWNLPYEPVWHSCWPAVEAGSVLGLRAGLLLGACVAAAAVVGPAKRAEAAAVASRTCLVPAALVVGALVGGAIAYGLARAGAAPLPASVVRQVGHVYRVSACYGLEYGSWVGGLAGTAAAASAILRKRRCGTREAAISADGTA